MKKTTIRSELILASLNSATSDILFTWRLTFPRMVLSEINVHRAASRNTSSTRAIPTKTMLKAVLGDMFVPQYIGKAQKGMQAGPQLTGWRRSIAEALWKAAGYSAVAFSYSLYKLGVAKEIAGRVVEPWSWCTQVFSATEVDNLFKLRNHEAAEPHFRELASQMQKQAEFAQLEFELMRHTGCKLTYWGTYQILEPGEWHVPFITKAEQNPVYGLTLEEAKRVSAARCARTSYTLVGSGRVTSVAEDIALCEKLFGSEPRHSSPCEHQAEALSESVFSANFKGWRQFRKEVESL